MPDLEHNFKYHAPTDKNAEKHAAVRAACHNAAKVIVDNLPLCREQATAITKLEEAMMWACAGIVRNS